MSHAKTPDASDQFEYGGGVMIGMGPNMNRALTRALTVSYTHLDVYKRQVDAPRWLHEMGLNAYEYQCGRGVNIGEETARKIAAQAALHDIAMSLHAPYYINLSNRDEERVQKNIGYVLASCQAATWLGADRIVVHTGGVGKQSRTKAFENTKENVRDILNAVEQAGYTTTICLETMGKQSVIGSAEEIFELVALCLLYTSRCV